MGDSLEWEIMPGLGACGVCEELETQVQCGRQVTPPTPGCQSDGSPCSDTGTARQEPHLSLGTGTAVARPFWG